MFFLLSLLSIISPHHPLLLLTTCETYVQTLNSLTIFLYICFCHLSSNNIIPFCLSQWYGYFFCLIHYIWFFIYLSHVQLSLWFYVFIVLLVSFPFFTISFSLNPVELVFPASPYPPPFFFFCRAHVTPSGVTRTVSDSRRTCYLVTRL